MKNAEKYRQIDRSIVLWHRSGIYIMSSMYGTCTKCKGEHQYKQRQTTVTAYLSSKQLLVFAFALQ